MLINFIKMKCIRTRHFCRRAINRPCIPRFDLAVVCTFLDIKVDYFQLCIPLPFLYIVHVILARHRPPNMSRLDCVFTYGPIRLFLTHVSNLQTFHCDHFDHGSDQSRFILILSIRFRILQLITLIQLDQRIWFCNGCLMTKLHVSRRLIRCQIHRIFVSKR